LLLLGRDPEQFKQVKRDPTLIPDAVEEGLRVHGPGYLAFARFAVDETSVGGIHIPKGTPVFCSMQAACYDPQAFHDPLRFDIHRKPRGIPIFGAGVHHCLGQVLARSILQTSLRLLLRRFPRLALVHRDFQPRYHGEFGEALMIELPMTTV
jgi:cytochrome P450